MELLRLRRMLCLPGHSREILNSQILVKEGIPGEVANLPEKRQVEHPSL
jgi:hypothetical protein